MQMGPRDALNALDALNEILYKKKHYYFYFLTKKNPDDQLTKFRRGNKNNGIFIRKVLKYK